MKWRLFDCFLGGSNHIALGRFTFADLLIYAFANFGSTVGWKLPEGTDNPRPVRGGAQPASLCCSVATGRIIPRHRRQLWA